MITSIGFSTIFDQSKLNAKVENPKLKCELLQFWQDEWPQKVKSGWDQEALAGLYWPRSFNNGALQCINVSLVIQV